MGQDSILRNEIVILYSFQFSFWMTYNDKGQGWKILLLLTVFKKLASSVSDVFQFSWNFQCFISFYLCRILSEYENSMLLVLWHHPQNHPNFLLFANGCVSNFSVFSLFLSLPFARVIFTVFCLSFCEAFSNGTIFVSPYVQVYKKGSLLYSEAATAVSSCVCFMWKKLNHHGNCWTDKSDEFMFPISDG